MCVANWIPNKILVHFRLHHASVTAYCHVPMSWQPCHWQDLTDFPVEQMDSIQSHIHCYSKTKTTITAQTALSRCVRSFQWDSPYHAFYSHSIISFPLERQSWGFGPELNHVSKKSQVFIKLDLIKTNSVTDALTVALHAKQRNRSAWVGIY